MELSTGNDENEDAALFVRLCTISGFSFDIRVEDPAESRFGARDAGASLESRRRIEKPAVLRAKGLKELISTSSPLHPGIQVPTLFIRLFVVGDSAGGASRELEDHEPIVPFCEPFHHSDSNDIDSGAAAANDAESAEGEKRPEGGPMRLMVAFSQDKDYRLCDEAKLMARLEQQLTVKPFGSDDKLSKYDRSREVAILCYHLAARVVPWEPVPASSSSSGAAHPDSLPPETAALHDNIRRAFTASRREFRKHRRNLALRDTGGWANFAVRAAAAPPFLREDRDFLRDLVEDARDVRPYLHNQDGWMYRKPPPSVSSILRFVAPRELRDSEDFVRNVVAAECAALAFASARLLCSEEFVRELLRDAQILGMDPCCVDEVFAAVNERLRDSETLARAAIRAQGAADRAADGAGRTRGAHSCPVVFRISSRLRTNRDLLRFALTEGQPPYAVGSVAPPEVKTLFSTQNASFHMAVVVRLALDFGKEAVDWRRIPRGAGLSPGSIWTITWGVVAGVTAGIRGIFFASQTTEGYLISFLYSTGISALVILALFFAEFAGRIRWFLRLRNV